MTANLVHLVVVALSAAYLVWLLRRLYTNRPNLTRIRAVAHLLQHVAVLFALDLILGLTLINNLWGSSPSAGWLTKAVYFFGLMIVAIIVYVPWQHRHNKARFGS
ncbi:MAG: hypothetical protein AAF513_05300 [Pseudomonadota bacterium]